MDTSDNNRTTIVLTFHNSKLLLGQFLAGCIKDNQNLSPAAKTAILDGRNIVYVSGITTWEISIKLTIGKLKIPESVYH